MGKKGTNKLSPLSNLFIVASHAHVVNGGNRAQLDEILNTGCSNLLKTLSDGYWTNRQKVSGYDYGKHELRSRFFTYTTNIPDLCADFNKSLKKVLETLPIIISDRARELVREYVKTRKPNLVNELQKYEGVIDEREKYRSLLSEIKKNELTRMQENDKRKVEIRADLQQFRADSMREFSKYYAEAINTDTIVQLLKKKGVKNTKEDVNLFGSSLQSMLQERCESILSKKTELLSESLKDYINAYSEKVSFAFSKHSIKVDFDAGWAFISALSKSGGVIGGVLANALIVAPIGLAVGLLIVTALGVVKLFGGGWEKSVAKKIVAAFEKNNVDEKFREGIRDFWEQTEKAFEHAAEELDGEWNAYVLELENMMESYNENDIRQKIASLKLVSEFFDNILLNIGRDAKC